MSTLTEWLTKPLIEEINIPVEIGDTVLMGRFKNKRVKVKSIDYNEKGDLLINGRPALKFRIVKDKQEESINENKISLRVPGDIKGLYKLFKKNKKQLYIVGGAVRDAILGKSPKDFDLATDAKPDEVLKIAKKGGFKTYEVGKSFGVVVVGGHEIATFRKDIGKGRRPDAVDFSDIQGDVNRRDLTINSLFYDIGRNEVVDLTGGLKDLKAKIIKTVGNPKRRFDEDPLRKLRALRFQAVVGGKMDKDTEIALLKNPSLKGVSFERIREEFIKAIQKGKNPKLFMEACDKFGFTKQMFPKLKITKPYPQVKDYVLFLAMILRKNDVSKLGKILNSLKYSAKESNNIQFLVYLTNFKPENIYMVKKAQDKTTLTPRQIVVWGGMVGKDFRKLATFKLSVRAGGDEFIGLKGKEIGDKIKDLEKKKFLGEAKRIPRKKGQHRGSSSHSDLYTDDNPKGTIKGLKFATVKDAQASVRKIKSSGKTHAHKIQAAVAMEQRAREMGKTAQAAVYRKYINQMKKKTKEKNEGWSDKYKKSIDCNNPKGFSQKAHCAGKKKNETSVPSPSRKMVNKMKKRGNTSVPYGSGYKKINENDKTELMKLYNKAMKMMPGSPRQKELQKKIKVLRKKLGMNENKQIKKTIGVFGGRFQPFHSGHLATYKWLSKQVDEAYITTSNIKQPPRHPMNFKEKVRHMVKMGIPKNRIVQETTPYVAKNLLKKFNPDTTAVVYAFGTKDAGRLKAGRKKTGEKTYYQDYKTSKGDIKGFEEHGYFVTAPQFGKVSGTQMRQLLGSPTVNDKEREKSFKKSFGYFDKGIYNMMTNKFKKLFEEFKLSNELIEEFILESTTQLSPTDDGPPTFYKGFSDYRKFSKKWLDSMYSGTGWKVVQYMLGKHAVNPDYDYTLKYNTVPAVAYGRKQSGDYGTRFGVDNPIKSYKDYIDGTVLKNLGYELVKWMGITPDGKNYTGVEVETPVVPGVGDDNVGNTKKKKLSIKERLDLTEEVKLLTEGGAYGHLNHPFDDKNLTFSDFKTLL